MSTIPPDSSYTPPPPPPPSGGGSIPDGKLVYPSTPPKDPILILILNLFLGGVGSIVLGQKNKGIAEIVLFIIVGLPTCGSGAALIGIITAIDGYLQAQQLHEGRPVGQWTFFGNHA
ncbi:MAG TPA: hypothetical protein VF911_05255 [Thermoanaerobaculia bacterium]